MYKSPANLSPRQAWPGIGCCFKYFITNPDRLALILISRVVSDYTSISPISFELKTYRLYLVNGTPESEICGRWKERKSGSIWLLYLHDIGDFPGCFVTKVRPIDKKFSSRKNKAVPLGLISCHKWTYRLNSCNTIKSKCSPNSIWCRWLGQNMSFHTLT